MTEIGYLNPKKEKRPGKKEKVMISHHRGGIKIEIIKNNIKCDEWVL
jgi:hypothetical protein